MAPKTKQIPMFFKCFNDVDGSQKLRLPEAWCSYMGRSLPYEAFLRNMHGDIWEVKVANYQNTDKFWFEEGWTKFAEENKLAADNDRIVFRYDGISTFDFQLFGKNGAETEYVRLPKETEQPQVMELEYAVLEFEPERDELRNMNPEPEPEVGQNLQLEEVQVIQLDPSLTPTESEYSASNGDYEDYEITRNFEGAITGSTRKTVGRKRARANNEEDEDYEINGVFEGQHIRSSRKTVGRQKRAPAIKEVDEEAIFRSGFPRPDNPYFVTKRRSKRNELFVPAVVVRDFNLTFPEEFVIRDEKGNPWTAKTQKWKDGRIWISRGWKAFCKWNNVKSEDWCIIEIVRPETPEAQMYLKTHLIPASALTAARSS